MSSDGDNTAAIVGGVLGTVTVLAIVAVIVLVVLQLKNCRGFHFTERKIKCVLCNTYKSSRPLHYNDMYTFVSRIPTKAAVIPASTNEAYELSKFSGEAAYE